MYIIPKSFYCPSGHGQSYTSKSDVEKARDETLAVQAKMNEERHLRAVAELERDKAIKAKKRLERRISAGVCTCCDRTFDNLAKHMATKHKNYGINAGKEPRQITA